jgi:hypothetical protein
MYVFNAVAYFKVLFLNILGKTLKIEGKRMKEASSVPGFEPFSLPSQSAGTYLVRFKFSLLTALNNSL